MKATKKISRTVIVIWIASIGIICYLSLKQKIELPFQFHHADKIHHTAAYLWLSALPFFGFTRLKQVMGGISFVIMMGFALEIGQYYIPGRLFSVIDMVANSIGVVLGISLGRYGRSYFKFVTEEVR